MKSARSGPRGRATRSDTGRTKTRRDRRSAPRWPTTATGRFSAPATSGSCVATSCTSRDGSRKSSSCTGETTTRTTSSSRCRTRTLPSSAARERRSASKPTAKSGSSSCRKCRGPRCAPSTRRRCWRDCARWSSRCTRSTSTTWCWCRRSRCRRRRAERFSGARRRRGISPMHSRWWLRQGARVPSADVPSAEVPSAGVPYARVSGAAIHQWLITRLSELRSIPPGQIDDRRPFESLGVDSLLAVQLSGELEEYLGVSLAPTLLYDHPSIGALTDHLAGRSGIAGRSTIAGLKSRATAALRTALRTPLNM